MVQYCFMPTADLPCVPDGDVVSICKAYFTTILGVVFDAFEAFRYQLDDRWYYTEDHFRRMDKSLEDALQELGLPREWITADTGPPESGKWRVLRRTQTVGCQLNPLFQSYLGKIINGPDEVAERKLIGERPRVLRSRRAHKGK
jgi:hypothetical protein